VLGNIYSKLYGNIVGMIWEQRGKLKIAKPMPPRPPSPPPQLKPK